MLNNLGIQPWQGKFLHPFFAGYSKYPANNILGHIPGKNPEEIVIVGAHYDHLGCVDPVNGDSICNGADDNASGVSAILQVARALIASGQQPERTVIFALWDAEEIGLLGSNHFVENSKYYDIPNPSVMIKGYINCDMIGRNNTHVAVFYPENKTIFGDWIKKDVKEYHLELNVEYPRPNDIPGGSDHIPFLNKDIPVIYYRTGWHSDYHQPGDEAHKINYGKVTDISKLVFLNLWNMANLKEF